MSQSPDGLEWSEAQIQQACDAFATTLRDYLGTLARRPVFPDLDRRALEQLVTEPPPEGGQPFAAVLDRFQRVVVPNATLGGSRPNGYYDRRPGSGQERFSGTWDQSRRRCY